MTFQRFAKGPFRGTTVTPRAVDEDVDHVAVRIHRTPQIMPFKVEGDEDFVQEPVISKPNFSSFQTPYSNPIFVYDVLSSNRQLDFGGPCSVQEIRGATGALVGPRPELFLCEQFDILN